MAAEHLLAFDAGTSGVRALIARPGAGTVAVARREWQYETTPEIAPFGKAFDAERFWSILSEAARAALKDAGLAGKDIAAVGVTSQRLGVVVIDRDGRALFTGPNVDARAFVEGLGIDAQMAGRVYASTGKLPSLLLAPARLRWLRNHRAADFERAAAVLAIGDWVAYRLTGELRSERSLAGDCGLLDISTRERNTELLAELDVPDRLLPPLVRSDEIAGAVTSGAAKETGLAAGTPVVIAGGDTQCALLGMGVTEPGEVGIAAGWSCPLQQVTAEPRIDVQRRTWTSLHVVPDRWVVESSTANAGQVWDWWCHTLLGDGAAALEEAAALVEQASTLGGDVFALLGPAAMNAGAMGLHQGGVLLTTPLAVGAVGRAELLRAALENIAYALRANLEQAEDVTGQPATRIAAGGGLTRVPLFARVLADALGRPVEVARDADVTGRGAAILAARGIGAANEGLAAGMEQTEPEAAAAAIHQSKYERWRRLGQALDALREGLS